MKSIHLDHLLKIACAISGFAALTTIAIYKRLDTSLDDKIYPLVLTLSVIFLHWLAWELYYDLIGLPSSFKKRIKKEKTQRKSGWRSFVAFAYVLLALSVFNFYMSPTFAEAGTGVGYALILMAVGLIGQMAYVTRHLISEKYKEEKA